MKRWLLGSLPLTLALTWPGHPTSAQSTRRWPVWRAEGNQTGARHGNSVSTAGDVNGDGYADLIVGAYYWDGPFFDEGRADVFYGSRFGPSRAADWTVTGSQTGGQLAANLGWAVSTAGDVNGDGFDDVLVGVGPKHPHHRAGLYLGSASGLATLPAWLGEWTFAYSLASAGDVNGDGFDDVIVANPTYSHDQPYEGVVLVYHGSPTGLRGAPNWGAEGDQEYCYFGGSVASAGDVNGDGFDDVLVGAPQFNNGQNNEGRAFLYLGSPSGLRRNPAWFAESDQGAATFGASLASAGDVNGDGYDDVAVSAPGFTNGEFGEGRHSVFLGSASGLPLVPSWTTESNQFSASAAGVSSGDLDGDGYSDLLVGYAAYDHPQNNEGRVFAYFGSPSGLHPHTRWAVEGNRQTSNFGFALSTAGDINGDGYDDVLVGAWSLDHELRDEGSSFAYLGSQRRSP